MKWIPVNTPPSSPSKYVTYEVYEYLVTDGFNVGISAFERGGGHVNKPWAAWSDFGAITPEKITHWMQIPPPPSQEGAT